MIKSMKKLSLVAMRSDLDALAKDLIWLSCVEVEKCSAPEGDAIIRSMDCGERIAELNSDAGTLSEALKILSPMRTDKKGFIKTRREMSKGEFDGRRTDKAIDGAKKASALKAEADQLKSERNKQTAYLASVSIWSGYDLPLGFEGTKNSTVIAGTLPVSCDIERLSAIAAEELGAVQIETVGEGKSVKYISAVCHISVEKQLTALLSDAGFIKNNFPAQTGLAADEVKATEEKIKALDARADEIKSELAAIAPLCPDIEYAYDRIKTELAEENVKQKLLGTGHTVIMTGWAPEDKVYKLTKTLSKYECNYVDLEKALDSYASELLDHDRTQDAITILEYAVAIGSDVGHTYLTLAGLYHDTGENAKTQELITHAREHASLNRQPFLDNMQDYLT